MFMEKSVEVKSKSELATMRQAGAVVASGRGSVRARRHCRHSTTIGAGGRRGPPIRGDAESSPAIRGNAESSPREIHERAEHPA